MADADNPQSVSALGVKQASKAMLQKQLCTIVTMPSGASAPVFVNTEAHLKFQFEDGLNDKSGADVQVSAVDDQRENADCKHRFLDAEMQN